MLSCVVETVKQAYTLSFAFILIGLVLETFLSDRFLFYFIYSDDSPDWTKILIFFFSLYPPFHYSKILKQMSAHSCSHFDVDEYRRVEGSGYTWDHFLTNDDGKI